MENTRHPGQFRLGAPEPAKLPGKNILIDPRHAPLRDMPSFLRIFAIQQNGRKSLDLPWIF